MDRQTAELEDHHLVVETTLSQLLSFCYENEEQELENDFQNIMKKIYDTLEIKIGKNTYKIILKPFYHIYHGYWLHDDFQSFSEYIGETEIYIVLVNPGSWNDFELILSRIKQLTEDTQIDYSKNVRYVKIPPSSPIHRW